MPTPITPSTFAAQIPSSAGSVCDKFQKAFKGFPRSFSDWYSYVYNEDGTFTDEFKLDICGIDCAALAATGGDAGVGTVLNTPAPVFTNNQADQVHITWPSVPGAAYYEVARNTEDNLYGATFVGYTTDTVYDDTGLAASTYFFYWVRARSATGVSGFSSTLTTFTAPSGSLALGTPVITASDATIPQYVACTWPTVAGATSYKVYRGSTNVFGSATLLFTTKQLFYNDFSGTPGTGYYYFVQAVNQFITAESVGDLGSR